MEEVMKNKLILALIILTLIFFISSVSSCFSNRRQKVDRDREVALRMDLEEKLSKSVGEKTKLENRVKELERLMEENNKAHEVTKSALSQEQLINKSLRDELEKITKLKEALEEDLKEALVTSPRKK